LLRGDATFVADTSAWWRAITLPEDLGELLDNAIRDDRMLVTPIVRMEILYSARTGTEYDSLEAELDALRILRNDRAVADTAMSAIRELAARSDGYHRVPLIDALIAAAAAEHGGLAVLHRDPHFDRLAEALEFRSVTVPGPQTGPAPWTEVRR
jgi:predicted nucleic acid-binding protein